MNRTLIMLLVLGAALLVSPDALAADGINICEKVDFESKNEAAQIVFNLICDVFNIVVGLVIAVIDAVVEGVKNIFTK